MGNTKPISEHTLGVWYGIAAYILWGILPVYWKVLKEVPALEILSNRIVWSFIFVFLLLLGKKEWYKIKDALADGKNRRGIILSSIIISVNWLIYIWAVNNGHVVESSLGYYINPLLTVLLGIVVLKERIDLWQVVALILALVGVGVITVAYGKVPWIALSLASTFALYGLAKKMVQVDAMTGLALETFFVTPLALGYLVVKHIMGTGAYGHVPVYIMLFLMASGIATATPLLWFAQGTKRVPLTTMGFIQYVSPSIQLILGVFLFKEPFTSAHVISFAFIWCGLAVYSLSRVNFAANVQLKFGKGKA